MTTTFPPWSWSYVDDLFERLFGVGLIGLVVVAAAVGGL